MENRRSGSDGTPVVLLLLHHLLLPQLQPQQSLSRQLVRGSSRESTTGTQDRSTDISIHLSPARRGEPDSLGADSVAPTIRLHHSPKQQNLPDAYHKQVQGPRGTRQPYSTYLGTMQTQTRLLYRIRLLSTGFICSSSRSSSFHHRSPFFSLGSFQCSPASSPYSSPYK
jgi:hypothetical protein